jgi:hypothetical protein
VHLGTSSGTVTSSELGFNSVAVINGVLLQRTPSLDEGLRAFEDALGTDAEAIPPQPAPLTRSSRSSSNSSTNASARPQHKAPLITEVKRHTESKDEGAAAEGDGERASALAVKPKTQEQKDEMWLASLPASILTGPNALRIKSLQRALKKHGLDKISAMSEDTIRQLYREWRDKEAPKRKALRMKKHPAGGGGGGSSARGRREEDDDDDDADGDGDAYVGPRKRRRAEKATTAAAVAAAPSGSKKAGRASSRRTKARSGAADGDTDSDNQGAGAGAGAGAALTAAHLQHHYSSYSLRRHGSASASEDGGGGGGGGLLRMGSSMSILSDL